MKSKILATIAACLAMGMGTAYAQTVKQCDDANHAKMNEITKLFNEGVKNKQVTNAEAADFKTAHEATKAVIAKANADKKLSMAECQDISSRLDTELALVKLITVPKPTLSPQQQAEVAACDKANATKVQTIIQTYNEGIKKKEVNKGEADEFKKLHDTTLASTAAKKKDGAYTPDECRDTSSRLDTELKLVKVITSPAKAAPNPNKTKGMVQRWETSFAAAQTLVHEGTEVRRITAAEAKQITDLIAQMRQFIAQKSKEQTPGQPFSFTLTEAEEDTVDNNIAAMFQRLAVYMSDAQRKAAAPLAAPAAAKK